MRTADIKVGKHYVVKRIYTGYPWRMVTPGKVKIVEKGVARKTDRFGSPIRNDGILVEIEVEDCKTGKRQTRTYNNLLTSRNVEFEWTDEYEAAYVAQRLYEEARAQDVRELTEALGPLNRVRCFGWNADVEKRRYNVDLVDLTREQVLAIAEVLG